MKIDVRTQTIFLLCGPIRAGKTTFARTLEKKILEQGRGYTVTVLSSDDMRLEAIGAKQHPHTPRMQEVSEAAFALLETKFKYAMDWRNRSDFIVVDTKGFEETFREMIRKQGQAAGYQVKLVQFEPDKEAYLNPDMIRESMYFVEGQDKEEQVQAYVKARARSISVYRRNILGNINFKGYDGTIRIRRYEDTNQMEVEITNGSLHHRTRSRVVQDANYIVIPDLHENVEAHNKIIADAKSRIPEGELTQLIYLGDYLDKGGDTKGILDIMYDAAFIQNAIIVAGNHENYIYQRLKDQIKDINLDLEKDYFTSIKFLQENEEYRERFFDIWETATVPFFKLYDPKLVHRTFFFTHAPCSNKYLGSMAGSSFKHMRNFYFNREQSKREQLAFLYSEAHYSDPVHVFGHVSHDGYSEFKNKYFLDMGIDVDNVAQYMLIKNGKHVLHQVYLKKGTEGYVSGLETDINRAWRPVKPFDIKDYNFTIPEERLLRMCRKNKVRFISGTMAPAGSKQGDIESLESGLLEFKKQGFEEVVLQPKYMGSRAQMYLFPSGEGHFFVSRSGYRVRDTEEFQALLAEQYDLFKHIFQEGDTEPLIIDSELLPWHALGEDLIERTFMSYGALVGNENSQLANDEAYAELEFNAKIDPNEKLDCLKVFAHNVELYGKPGPASVRPFEVMTYRDRFKFGAHKQFQQINPDKCLVVSLKDEDFAYSLKAAYEFFDDLTIAKNMEGVVIKPLVEVEGKIPYMKVRNESYLTLIYGYDYVTKYEKLCDTKNVQGKTRLAILERTLGNQMLNSEVDSPKWTEAIVKLIAALREEKTLDPRL